MQSFPSLIFVDGGNPVETARAQQLLGHVDGQTTNPTLIAKNPDVMKYLIGGKKLTQEEALAEYKKIVESIAKITTGPISIQVIADQTSSKDDMLAQARRFRGWIPNGVIKFPCTSEGLAAAEIFCQEWSINITLNFSQAQAAAVYAATKNAKHRVFISPFVGRLDDRGENGMDVVVNTLKMYHNAPVKTLNNPTLPPLNLRGGEEGLRGGQGELSGSNKCHVEVLTASVRRLSHLLFALYLKSPAITAPIKILEEWSAAKFVQPMENFKYESLNLKQIPYQELDLNQDWRSFDIYHDLTDSGLTKFMEDWKSLIKR